MGDRSGQYIYTSSNQEATTATKKSKTYTTLANHHISRHPHTVITRLPTPTVPDTAYLLDLPWELLDDRLRASNRNALTARTATRKCWSGVAVITPGRRGGHTTLEAVGTRTLVRLCDPGVAGGCEAAVAGVGGAAGGFGAAFNVFGEVRALC